MIKDTLGNTEIVDELECQGCGAVLKFKPGTNHLGCEYCGTENEIKQQEGPVIIEETSLEEYFNEGIKQEDTIEVVAVRCDNCGAQTTLDPNVSAENCPFCDSPLVIKGGSTSLMYKPKYLLPFKINRNEALGKYKSWLKSLWFAPSDLKMYANNTEHFFGIYIPYWTYDCNTNTRYNGERGDDYVERQRYRTVEKGRTVNRVRNVTKTRWRPTHGRVSNFFDDILVVATKSIHVGRMEKIKFWDLGNLVDYDDKYLSGFRAETYQVKIEEGYEEAKRKMNGSIRAAVARDIGGDRQRIHQMKTQYSNAKFKQVLLPLWISAYRYKGKVFQFVVNGRNGAVSGARPYSAAKIAVAVVLGLVAIVAITFLMGYLPG